MSEPQHEQFDGWPALYAVGALSPAEREGFGTHLEVCRECVDEVRELLAVTHGLAHTVPALDAPSALRTRVLQEITGTRPTQSRSGADGGVALASPVNEDAASGDAHDAEPPRGGPGALFWLAASLVVAAAGGGGWYVAGLDRQITGLETELAASTHNAERLRLDAAATSTAAAERDAVLAIVAGTGAQQLTLVGQPLAPRATARAVWTDAAEMVLLASGLPPLPDGDVYQLWFVLPEAPVSAALLDPDPDGGATVIVAIPDAVPLPAVMAITVEAAGGAEAPTGDVYLLGQPAQ
ncbi:MAG: anti-sigma factor [Vicinamibacterales bacterium]|nr:anti-sigma factor [Vicinamibacterales bacterium]